MKIFWCLALLALGAAFIATSDLSAQSKTLPSGVSGLDSLSNYCKDIFSKNCSGCHGEKGQGIVGPNLTDKYWLHGGGLKNVGNTLKAGVAGKGMISWNEVFSPQDIRQIAEYVVSLQGADPPKAKKPEGEIYEGKKD